MLAPRRVLEYTLERYLPTARLLRRTGGRAVATTLELEVRLSWPRWDRESNFPAGAPPGHRAFLGEG